MKTWMMTIEFSKQTSEVTLHYANSMQVMSGFPAVELIGRDQIKTKFHSYDLRKFDHFATYEEGIVFHTILRVKVPRVVRTLAICQTFDDRFSCVLIEEEHIHRANLGRKSHAQSLTIDSVAFTHMPSMADPRRLETQFKNVLQGERIL